MLPIDLNKLSSYFIYDPQRPLTFTSPFFLVLFTLFFGMFLIVYRHHYAKIIYVTLFSLFFYYKSSGLYFLLLIASAITDFTLALWLDSAQKDWKRRAILTLSVILNLSLLGYFKYTNFFISVINMGATVPMDTWDIFLPVGVSFFTFQSISYIIDVYRKEIKPLTNFLEYSFFISFFPQLVAGPIVRAKDFIPQIRKPNVVSSYEFNKALFLIMCGLFKKAVISDYISTNFVDRIFDNPTLYSGVENLMGVYGYAIQIYCDFSGYTDIAIGVAMLLGYHLPINFDSPYISSSITEFWRRWHISLSTWLKDYL
ncbi:MAG TPA: MBOAT family O-acyltransferase, partial [Cytophagales bacterium]|nr:MBOAT family O-acyltransferase [Cytophagales bacterium]